MFQKSEDASLFRPTIRPRISGYGLAITPLSAPSLLPGTAIATFVNGHYPNAPHGNHAAIFVGAVKDGIKVLDQWVGHAPIQRVIKFNHMPNAGVAQCPEKYSVVL